VTATTLSARLCVPHLDRTLGCDAIDDATGAMCLLVEVLYQAAWRAHERRRELAHASACKREYQLNTN